MNEDFYKKSEPGCSLKTAISNFFKYYATFSGRSSRSEYWLWALFNFIVTIPFVMMYTLGIISSQQRGYYDSYGYYNSYTNEGAVAVAIIGIVIVLIWSLATFLPNLALVIRRLHDTGRSGAWYFIAFVPFIGAIVLLIFTLQDSDRFVNEYGGVKGHDYTAKQQFVSTPNMPAPETPKPKSVDVAAELDKYGKLLKDGLLTQEEYDAVKKRLLDL